VLKPDGAFWLAIGDEYAAELKVMLTREREQPLFLRSWVVWYYTFGVNCKNKFSRSHAHLLYFVKNRERFTFNADDPAMRVPSARQLVYADKRANPKGRLPDDTWITPPAAESRESRVEGRETSDESRECNGVYDPQPSTLNSQPLTHNGWFLRPQDVPNGFAADGDVWYFPRVAGTFKERSGWHGCQMPERLLARIIQSCSNEGEVVLDPFAGSGTTLAVAKKLGRQWLGYDMSTEYVARATSRLDAITPGDPLTGAENPLTSVPTTGKGRKLRTH
jgi:site-specific DNA-methyltransferase (adenine-specific)